MNAFRLALSGAISRENPIYAQLGIENVYRFSRRDEISFGNIRTPLIIIGDKSLVSVSRFDRSPLCLLTEGSLINFDNYFSEVDFERKKLLNEYGGLRFRAENEVILGELSNPKDVYRALARTLGIFREFVRFNRLNRSSKMGGLTALNEMEAYLFRNQIKAPNRKLVARSVGIAPETYSRMISNGILDLSDEERETIFYQKLKNK